MGKILKIHRFSITPFFLLLVLSISCRQNVPVQKAKSENQLAQVETELQRLASIWYPKTIDRINGGFWSDFDHQWNKKGSQNKFLVSQARHVWTAATLADYYNNDRYIEIAAHGHKFLKKRMWDSVNGGFHSLFAIEGGSLKLLSTAKSAYGNSFAIYGLATYYKVSNDTTALNLAKETFRWLEKHAYDSVYGGYFDVMKMDGSWLLDVPENDKNYDNFSRKDWKDQNSSIHLLECFTALYEVWPNELLKKRLEELLLIIRDTIVTERGYLTLHLERDWTPISLKDSSETFRKENFWMDHVSFGHDVETAFLMLEASHMLGRKNDTLTEIKAKQMVDHAVDNGWDNEKGGFYDGGFYHEPAKCTIENKAKIWWTEAEGLNSLLLMSKLYPEEKGFYELFQKQWGYIKTNMIDHNHGGWYAEGLDTDPESLYGAKAQIWKANYHNVRSLINVTQMLKGEFVLTQQDHKE